MTHAIAHVAHLLQAAVAGDTVYTVALSPPPSLFDRITHVASGLVSVALLLLLVALILAVLSLLKSYRRVNEVVTKLQNDLQPLIGHANGIADNVNYITSSVREDVQQINATIASANRRVHEAMRMTEDRLRQFNGLLEVVQDEAEQVFVNTASAVRGVRRGAEALRGRRRNGPDLALRDDDLDDDESELLEDMEDEYGDERDTEAAPYDGPARPRVRRRGRRDV